MNYLKYFNQGLLNSMVRDKQNANVGAKILYLSKEFKDKFNYILDEESAVLINSAEKNIGHQVKLSYSIIKTNMVNFLNCISGFAFSNNVSEFFIEIVQSYIDKMIVTLKKMSEIYKEKGQVSKSQIENMDKYFLNSLSCNFYTLIVTINSYNENRGLLSEEVENKLKELYISLMGMVNSLSTNIESYIPKNETIRKSLVISSPPKTERQGNSLEIPLEVGKTHNIHLEMSI